MQKTKKHTKKTNTHIQSTFSQHIFHLTDTEQETFVLVFNDENFLHTDETHRICVANVLVPKFKKKKHMCNEWVENIIYEWECVYDLPVKSLICEWEPIPPHPAKENRELSHFILTLNRLVHYTLTKHTKRWYCVRLFGIKSVCIGMHGLKFRFLMRNKRVPESGLHLQPALLDHCLQRHIVLNEHDTCQWVM